MQHCRWALHKHAHVHAIVGWMGCESLLFWACLLVEVGMSMSWLRVHGPAGSNSTRNDFLLLSCSNFKTTNHSQPLARRAAPEQVPVSPVKKRAMLSIVRPRILHFATKKFIFCMCACVVLGPTTTVNSHRSHLPRHGSKK